jgi:hypothetical protein
LRGDDTQVLVGGIEAPSLDEVSSTRIVLSIPAGVQAGTRAVRIVNRAMIGTPPSPHAGVESNPRSFQLRPRITDPVNASVQGSGNQPRSGDVTVQLSPEVGRTQRVTLLLNEKQPPATRPPRSNTFEAPPRTQPTDPETSASVTIPVSGLIAGQYLVRVRVDGAESLLETNASGEYDAPEVDIP